MYVRCGVNSSFDIVLHDCVRYRLSFSYPCDSCDAVYTACERYSHQTSRPTYDICFVLALYLLTYAIMRQAFADRPCVTV